MVLWEKQWLLWLKKKKKRKENAWAKVMKE